MEFEDRDIRVDRSYIDELIALGSQATPTTVVEEDGRQEVVIGFDRARLSRLLGLR